MAHYKKFYTQDFSEKIEIRHEESVLFSGDDYGTVIGVHLFENGAPYSGGGTVSAKVVRSDGGEVALSGAISGNTVSVTLLESCLAVPGTIGLYVRLTSGNEKTTVLSVIYTVQGTAGGTIIDPGSVVTDAEDLITRINTAIESIPADYSELLAAVAPTFSDSTPYAAGVYVWYINGTTTKLYKFTAAHAAGSWTGTDAVQVSVGNELADLKSAVSDVNMSAPIYDNEYYQSGTISSIGNNDSTTVSRIRSGVYALTQITNGDGYYIDNLYEAKVAIYSANAIISANLVEWLSDDWGNGYIQIPSGYAGKYAAILVRKIGHESDDISSDLASISDHVKYKSLAKYIDNGAVVAGNNLLPLKAYGNVYKGVTIDINNGIISLNGTSTEIIRLKVSGLYAISKNASASWATERVSQFETGKKYSLHNHIVSGALPASVGVSLRDTTGAAAVSASIPEATLADAISYAMLYIPSGTALNVKFIPIFIEGGVTDAAYDKKLNPRIYTGTSYAMPDLTADFVYNATYECAIAFPSTYKTDGEPTPLIILAHGLSSTITASAWGSADMLALVKSFASDGYAVIDVNQVTAQDWCNPALIKKYVAAIQYAVKMYNVVPAFVFGESMGSLIGLRLAKQYPSIKACVISGIRLDFAARYAEATTAQKEIIDANLGFTNGYDAYIAAGWDVTAVSAVSDDNEKICPVDFPPTFFIYGTEDTLTKTESLAKIEEIKRGGTIVSSAEYTGDHNAVCYLKAGTSYDDAIKWLGDWS